MYPPKPSSIILITVIYAISGMIRRRLLSVITANMTVRTAGIITNVNKKSASIGLTNPCATAAVINKRVKTIVFSNSFFLLSTTALPLFSSSRFIAIALMEVLTRSIPKITTNPIIEKKSTATPV